MKAFMTRRKSFFVAATAALALSLTACGGSTPGTTNPTVAEKPTFAAGTTMAKLSSAGTIKIGTKYAQPLWCAVRSIRIARSSASISVSSATSSRSVMAAIRPAIAALRAWVAASCFAYQLCFAISVSPCSLLLFRLMYSNVVRWNSQAFSGLFSCILLYSFWR